MLGPARTDRFWLGRGPFIPGGSQLHRAGSFAFLAPMPLRAVQALPHPAIIANKNLFSHANLVSTASRGVCQVLFSGRVTICLAPGGSRRGGRRLRKRAVFGGKKLASPMAVSTMHIESRAFRLFYEPNDCSEARVVCPVYRRWFGRLCDRCQQKTLSAAGQIE